MFARRGTFQIDPARVDEYIALSDDTRGRLKDLQGVHSIFVFVNRDTGEGMTLGVYADEGASRAARSKIGEAWDTVSHLLLQPPQFTEFTTVEQLK
jgi:hypothetical protein